MTTTALKTPSPKTPPLKPTLLSHLRRARDHIDRHYQMPLDLERLARVAGVSKYHFARRFEAAYGETAMRYLTRRRVERAQDLLRAANLTVTEICMLVGFSSLGSFSARFTQLVGENPTAYRDRWARQGGPHVPGCWLFMRVGGVSAFSAARVSGTLDAPSAKQQRVARENRAKTAISEKAEPVNRNYGG